MSRFPKLSYYFEGAKKKGIVNQLRQMTYDFYYNQKFRAYTFESENEYQYNTSYTATEKTIQKSEFGDSYRNTPSPYFQIHQGFNALPLKKSTIHLLDIGCGSGKVLLVGMALGFKSVTGIDLDAEAILLAKKNCFQASKSFSQTQYFVGEADAANYSIAKDINVIFLFNPFGIETLKKVIDSIRLSFSFAKREIFIIYSNPLYSNLFKEDGIFEVYYFNRVRTGDIDLIIYRISV